MSFSYAPVTLPIHWIFNVLIHIQHSLKLLAISPNGTSNSPVSQKINDPFQHIEASKVRHMRHLPPM
ncbi:MAG: hypothetical protein V7750_17840 [Sneathiella sp.]